MSMPLRFALSENPAMTLPDVGHAQSTLASSISGTRADSVRGGDGVAVATVGDAGAAAGGVAVPAAGAAAGVGPGAAARVGAGDAPAGEEPDPNCASACSEYGNFIARGSLLSVGVLPCPGAVISARVSLVGAMDGVLTKGAVTTPPAPAPGPACPGRESAST